MRILLKDIRPNPNNPRVKRGDDFKRLKTSLAQFPQMLLVRGLGVVQNSDGTWTVLGGNQRRGGLVELEKEFGRPAFDKYGADEKAREILEDYFNNGIPCEDCTNFSEEQRQRFVIADNLNYADWDMEAVRAGWTADEIGEWGTGDLFDAWGAVADSDQFGTSFSLPEGDKEPFQQITFTFADEQAQAVKEAIQKAKQMEGFKNVETMGNQNSNGNSLYFIVKQWAEQKKLL